MIPLKSLEELKIMQECAQIVAKTREAVRSWVRPGISTRELDQQAEQMIREFGAKPAFKGYHGFPATLCTSINEQVVHGIPSERRLQEGDILGVDMGALWQGYYGDTAFTCAVGAISDKAKRLLEVTEEALYRGIEAAQPGARVNDIGAAVQSFVEDAGFSVVREFVGHGIGRQLHEDPQIPNYGKGGTGPKLQPGMVLAIEPMVNMGAAGVKVLADGWTAVTQDGSLSAHFEHTIAITEEGPEILTKT